LEEIRKVSRELAELIGSISAQTQKQSASVSDVTRGMQGILKITEETTEGTKQTNVTIGQLTRLAAELRSSVAGFRSDAEAAIRQPPAGAGAVLAQTTGID
jgi:twitching motility protein PilJ